MQGMRTCLSLVALVAIMFVMATSSRGRPGGVVLLESSMVYDIGPQTADTAVQVAEQIRPHLGTAFLMTHNMSATSAYAGDEGGGLSVQCSGGGDGGVGASRVPAVV